MSAAVALKSLVINPVAKHTATVIFVHGLGDSGHGWAPLAQQFARDPRLQHVKWVLPHAVEMRVTANMGMVMPSWFDIKTFELETQEVEPGMLRSSMALNKLISTEVDAGIDASRVVLGGFSQGGAMSLLTGLTGERTLGGLVVLSGWLPLNAKFKSMATDAVKRTPIFWGHGKADPLVKYQFAEASVKFLKEQLGVPISEDRLTFKSYEGLEHSSDPQEIADVHSWLVNRLRA
ncbi:Phospholipase/carboxylesterase [Pterulicium gracile]|uniref:Acyl-protein thioesterase 1 n=1 Tax=Pterulicium gracile TaxID=1884261 RepID=A0A5C3QZU3_9AGAR|nr:Phospholipase/carboxylesterase [Pterula gracilis]